MSKTSTDVAVPETANLPALASTPALGLSASDISLPKLYRGESQSNAFKDKLVPLGSIFIASGGDDPEPQVVWEEGTEEGILFHVLAVQKGKSISVDGDLQTFAFDDPSAPDDAWTTFTYVVALPEIDDEIPVKLLMTKTSTPTAKRINFLLLKNEGNPSYNLAFRLSLTERKAEKGGQKFQWYVWNASTVEADPKNVAIAAKVAQLVAAPASNNIERSAGTEPAI